jgi:hypothetical protein
VVSTDVEAGRIAVAVGLTSHSAILHAATRARIEEMLRANKAKRALVEAAQKAQISPLDSPQTVFPREDDGALTLLFSEAQKAAAVLQPKIDMVFGILAAGQADREKITEKRWQAGYDLAMGRVLALKVRTDAYNQMLAQAKSGLKFKNPASDTWVLEPHDTVKNVGSQNEKLAAQARTYLERVVREHPRPAHSQDWPARLRALHGDQPQPAGTAVELLRDLRDQE